MTVTIFGSLAVALSGSHSPEARRISIESLEMLFRYRFICIGVTVTLFPLLP